MPYTTTYVDDGKGFHKTASGVVVGLDIFTSALQASQDEARARNLCYGLFDFSGTIELKVTPGRHPPDRRKSTASSRLLSPGRSSPSWPRPRCPTPWPGCGHTLSDDLPWKSCVFHHRAEGRLLAAPGTCAPGRDERRYRRISFVGTSGALRADGPTL